MHSILVCAALAIVGGVPHVAAAPMQRSDGGGDEVAGPECPILVCPANLMPVCGSNGKLYDNECLLKAAQCDYPDLEKVDEGSCSCLDKKACTMEIRRVCGSDGETYANPCLLEAVRDCYNEDLEQVSEGECPKPSQTEDCELRACTADRRPVCGSDGVTYPNKCFLEIAQCRDPSLTKESDGECDTPPPKVDKDCRDIDACTLDFEPVCGSDGVTYTNACFFEVAQCTNPDLTKDDDDSHCPEIDCVALIPCPLNMEPVCGSDGVTYSNECVLNANKCKNSELELVSAGPCPVEEELAGTGGANDGAGNAGGANDGAMACGQMCTMDWRPVCGSNGVTYGNECMFEAAACLDPFITKASDGECEQTDSGCGAPTNVEYWTGEPYEVDDGTAFQIAGSWVGVQGATAYVVCYTAVTESTGETVKACHGAPVTEESGSVSDDEANAGFANAGAANSGEIFTWDEGVLVFAEGDEPATITSFTVRAKGDGDCERPEAEGEQADSADKTFATVCTADESEASRDLVDDVALEVVDDDDTLLTFDVTVDPTSEGRDIPRWEGCIGLNMADDVKEVKCRFVENLDGEKSFTWSYQVRKDDEANSYFASVSAAGSCSLPAKSDSIKP